MHILIYRFGNRSIPLKKYLQTAINISIRFVFFLPHSMKCSSSSWAPISGGLKSGCVSKKGWLSIMEVIPESFQSLGVFFLRFYCVGTEFYFGAKFLKCSASNIVYFFIFLLNRTLKIRFSVFSVAQVSESPSRIEQFLRCLLD